MKRDLSNYREIYQKHLLLEKDCPKTPFELFDRWFDVATTIERGEANAMQMATLGCDGFPRARVVLLKFFDENGFVFYTNYNSEKGKSIAQNNQIGLSFFWQESQRQIHIKGTAQKIPAKKSDVYFQSRPIGSQLGAWASTQSSPIKNRAVLENNLKAVLEKFEGVEIPRPEHWGGYLVTPSEMEFWQGRNDRLHDRIVYRLENQQWHFCRLSP